MDDLLDEVPRAAGELGLKEAALFLLEAGEEQLTDTRGGRRLRTDGGDVASRSVLQRQTVIEHGVAGTPVFVEGRVVGALRATVQEAAPLEALAREVSAGVVAARLRDDLNLLTIHATEWLAAAQEALAPGGAGHIWRVGWLGTRLAERLGFSLRDRHRIWLAEQLHDLGYVIGASRPLQQHPLVGANALRHVPLLADAADLVELHHERFDGSGGPDRRRGDQIPLEAYVLILADAFDEMAVSAGLTRGPEFLLAAFAAQSAAHHPRVVAALRDLPLHQLYR
ncbi:MAG: HD-GYP domain-containing protein [Candidatus Xenobia bacterium]